MRGMEVGWYRPPEELLSFDLSAPMDIWAIGCIFVEVVTKLPLFYGNSAKEHCYQIFHMLGTPTERSWPGVTQLKNYGLVPQNIDAKPIERVARGLDKLEPHGIHLLERMLKLNPAERITARDALRHVSRFLI